MLCFEGIALNLNIFLGRASIPNYRLVAPAGGELQVMNVDKEVGRYTRARSSVLLTDDRLHG